jgi:hypothetical protein
MLFSSLMTFALFAAQPASFEPALSQATPGSIVQTPLASIDAVPQHDVTITPIDRTPPLIISDKPEYFRTGDGIALHQRLEPGTYRLYVYHVPVPGIPEGTSKRIVTRLKSLDDQPVTLTVNRQTAIPLGGDYHKLAKLGMRALIDPAVVDTSPVEFTGSLVLDQSAATDKRDLLHHAIVEFTIDRPVEIATAQLTEGDSPDRIDSLEKLPLVLPGFHASGAGRGLFPQAEFAVDAGEYDTASGARKLVVADGESDPWMVGTDGITGESQMNKGNYGAIYRMKLRYRSTDGRGLAMLMVTDRFDSRWCQAVAAVVRVSDGNHSGGVIDLPRDAVRFRILPEAVVIQTFPPAAPGETREIELDYTPPGASCLPTPILLVPID